MCIDSAPLIWIEAISLWVLTRLYFEQTPHNANQGDKNCASNSNLSCLQNNSLDHIPLVLDVNPHEGERNLGPAIHAACG